MMPYIDSYLPWGVKSTDMPDLRVAFICPECGEEIYEGDSYYLYDNNEITCTDNACRYVELCKHELVDTYYMPRYCTLDDKIGDFAQFIGLWRYVGEDDYKHMPIEVMFIGNQGQSLIREFCEQDWTDFLDYVDKELGVKFKKAVIRNE